MKFFVCCLVAIIHTITFANDSKQSLFVVDGDSVNVDLVVFLDLAKEPIILKGNKLHLYVWGW